MFEQIVAKAATPEVAEQVVVQMSTSERFTEMVVCTTIGIATVFVVLMLFWGLLELMHVVMERASKPKTQKNVETVVEKPVQTATDDTQLVAVLTAAVACMLEAQGAPATSFKIKSFRRTN